uniref:Uncharacterized protein n=1 Tax=Anguilla anguilla TaxID=7936 RepID=A0A0E9QDD7_ANGAN
MAATTVHKFIPKPVNSPSFTDIINLCFSAYIYRFICCLFSQCSLAHSSQIYQFKNGNK